MTINIPLVWIAVALFVAVEAGLLYCYHIADTHWQNTIVFGASVVAGAFALFSYLKGIEERRKQSAERLIERWNDPGLAAFKKPVREITEAELDARTLMRTSKGQKLPAEVLTVRTQVVGRPLASMKRSR